MLIIEVKKIECNHFKCNVEIYNNIYLYAFIYHSK